MQLSLTSRAPLITLIFSWCLGLMPVLVLTIPLGVHIASISLLLMAILVFILVFLGWVFLSPFIGLGIVALAGVFFYLTFDELISSA